MPASEGFYRDQKRLHVVFCFTGFVMLAVTVWMMAEDHLREYKQHQRIFSRMRESELSDEVVEAQRNIDRQKLSDLRAQLEKLDASGAEHDQKLEGLAAKLVELEPVQAERTREVQFRKADQSEQLSFYQKIVKEIETVDPEEEPARLRRLEQQRAESMEKLELLATQIRAGTAAMEAVDQDIAGIKGQIDEIDRSRNQIKDEITALTKERDGLDKSLEAAHYGLAEAIRSAPILDGFASAVNINQIALPQLPLDYSMAKAIRFDRCTSCHLGTDDKRMRKDAGIPQPYCVHPNLDLYVSAQSPHPADRFGCTICHQGQGSATEFKWASHTPADSAQTKEWTDKYGWFFNEFHKWPMRPDRFIESSCLKCHHDPYQIPQAKKLLLGYQTMVRVGCYSCHEINGYNDAGLQVGMHLRTTQGAKDNEVDASRALRKLGPSLMRVPQKLTPEWVRKWIRDPLAFRPTTKMPRFYHQLDSRGDKAHSYFGEAPPEEFDNPHDLPELAVAEIYAITEYLFDAGKKQLGDATLPPVGAKGDAARGKSLFATKGCVACHNHKEVVSLKAKNFGPDLSELQAKFTSPEQAQWLVAWIRNPTFYHEKSYMPNLQLTEQEAADVASYLLSVEGKWAREVTVPELDPLALRDLLVNLMSKGQSRIKAVATIDGDGTAANPGMSTHAQLVELGQRTVSRLGCFGCHDIPGFEAAKPIGTSLANWGWKNTHQIAFENIHEYVDNQLHEEGENSFFARNEYFLEALHEHQREGFLIQKLREPRSYDFKRVKRWDDRARMPRFNLTEEEQEAVATVVLGLTGEEINRDYIYHPKNDDTTKPVINKAVWPRHYTAKEKQAIIDGRSMLVKYNCIGCHVVEPGTFRFTPTEDQANDLIDVAKADLAKDFSFPGHPAWNVAEPDEGSELVIRGLSEGAEDPNESDDPRHFVRLWEATSVRGEVLPAGQQVAIPASQFKPRNNVAPYGGLYAQWLVDHFIKQSGVEAIDLAGLQVERNKAWAQAPPPLLREGEKVQPNWLYRFLRDPFKIRPAAALFMPRFNYRGGDAIKLGNYFAAVDAVSFPYVEVEERTPSYLSERDAEHPGYLKDAWELVTLADAQAKLCASCHPVGGVNPQGKPEEIGPPLVLAPERFRPDWLERWIANPQRLLPYTGMPANFNKATPRFQAQFKGEAIEQVRAARDALMNYNSLTEDVLVEQRRTKVTQTEQAKEDAR